MRGQEPGPRDNMDTHSYLSLQNDSDFFCVLFPSSTAHWGPNPRHTRETSLQMADHLHVVAGVSISTQGPEGQDRDGHRPSGRAWKETRSLSLGPAGPRMGPAGPGLLGPRPTGPRVLPGKSPLGGATCINQCKRSSSVWGPVTSLPTRSKMHAQSEQSAHAHKASTRSSASVEHRRRCAEVCWQAATDACSCLTTALIKILTFQGPPQTRVKNATQACCEILFVFFVVTASFLLVRSSFFFCEI